MARASRRDELVQAALTYFVDRGTEGTSVGAIASEVGVSKAAVSYHFPSKDDIVLAVAEPLVAELEAVVPSDGVSSDWPDGVRNLVEDYIDALLLHRDVAEWLDGDRAALLGTDVGERLRRNHAAMRRALACGRTDERARIATTVALGALWRPVRNVPADAVSAHRDLIIEAALAPLRLLH